MSINVELLRKVKSHVLTHPESVNMFRYRNACGTVGCVAFHAVELSGEKPDKSISSSEQAQQVLGLTYPQACELFVPNEILSLNSRILLPPACTAEHALWVSNHIKKFIAKYQYQSLL